MTNRQPQAPARSRFQPPAHIRHGRAAAVMCAIILMVFGVIVWHLTNEYAHICSSGIIYALAPSKCGLADFWHGLGVVFFWAGVFITIAVAGLTRMDAGNRRGRYYL